MPGGELRVLMPAEEVRGEIESGSAVGSRKEEVLSKQHPHKKTLLMAIMLGMAEVMLKV
jgi:hypothetical protein